MFAKRKLVKKQSCSNRYGIALERLGMAQNPWRPSYIARNGRLVLYLDTPLATSSGSASSGSLRQTLHHRPRFDEEGDDDIIAYDSKTTVAPRRVCGERAHAKAWVQATSATSSGNSTVSPVSTVSAIVSVSTAQHFRPLPTRLRMQPEFADPILLYLCESLLAARALPTPIRALRLPN